MTALPMRWVPRESKTSHVMRAGIAIGGVNINVCDWHAECFCSDLARDRLHALPEVDGRKGYREFAVRVGMNQRLARITAEVHADWVIYRCETATAMTWHQRLLKPESEENRIRA